MTTELTTRSNGAMIAAPELPSYEIMERVLGTGDIANLTPRQKVDYYVNLCQSVGLNPMSRPFEFISFQGKTIPYAKKDCADQLRKMHCVSIEIRGREFADGMYTVTAFAKLPNNRTDESTGVVPIGNLQGEARANAYMKAETKAKRRVTLSICGLGFLDESEIDSIPGAQRVRFDPQSGDMDVPKAQAHFEPVIDETAAKRKQIGEACNVIIKSLTKENKAKAQQWIKAAFGGKTIPQLSIEELQRLYDELTAPVSGDYDQNHPDGTTFHNAVTAKAGVPSGHAEGEGYVSEKAAPDDENDDPFRD